MGGTNNALWNDHHRGIMQAWGMSCTFGLAWFTLTTSRPDEPKTFVKHETDYRVYKQTCVRLSLFVVFVALWNGSMGKLPTGTWYSGPLL